MNKTLVTFFMIVTDPDLVIADYAVKSYQKVTSVPFKLRIYSNWVSADRKRKYFNSWKKFSFVEIEPNDWQDSQSKPEDPKLEGPFEKCTTIWDRELKCIETPFIATVDADFEILDPKFISVVFSRLQGNSNLAVISTDYSPKNTAYHDSYSGEVICLNERWHTWFCLYRKSALNKTNISHYYYEEALVGPVKRNAWDSSGYLQKSLKDEYGYELEVLDSKHQTSFIHYGAFSKNQKIDENNIEIYRTLMILAKRGFTSRGDWLGRLVGKIALKILFPSLGRDKYWHGWGA